MLVPEGQYMNRLFPNLMVQDMEQTLTFYQNLGFSVLSKMPEESPVWALVELDGIKIMFQSKPSLTAEFPQLADQQSGGALTLWINTPNVKKYFERASIQCKLLKPLGVTDYNGATEFVLRDPDGFILHFSDLEM
ncbi:hypothetical protein GCM10007879_07040 [Maritalea porphyrae]|uniref:VOC domain-containing protein n=2 Tax=Maritalea porphyrae TaxID=880732 RepID=A0ABQ5UMD1_9HYPH|nr:hypothetical protein GCM10007879_07040 [Maritalea porphyrae]